VNLVNWKPCISCSMPVIGSLERSLLLVVHSIHVFYYSRPHRMSCVSREWSCLLRQWETESVDTVSDSLIHFLFFVSILTQCIDDSKSSVKSEFALFIRICIMSVHLSCHVSLSLSFFLDWINVDPSSLMSLILCHSWFFSKNQRREIAFLSSFSSSLYKRRKEDWCYLFQRR
jgi:hypothetical protein